MKVHRDSHPICNSEYEYLIKAQQFGFFQDGFIQDDITSCDDWIVAVWINELADKYKKNDELFLKEVLPNFKKWLDASDLKNYSGVGYGYDVLSMAQSLGIEINKMSVRMLVSSELLEKMQNLLKPRKSYFEQTLSRFEFEEIIENLRRFNKLGMPFGMHIGNYYDDLLRMEVDLLECGKSISYSSLVFLDTCPREKYEELFELQQKISEKYGYNSCDAKEIELLGNLMTGRNWTVSNRFYSESQDIQNKIFKLISTEREDIVNSFKPYIGQVAEISYLVIGEDGSSELKKFIGEIKRVDLNGASLENEKYEKTNFFTTESYSTGPKSIRYQYIFINAYVNRKCIYYKTKKEIDALTKLTNERYSAIRKMNNCLESGDVLKRFWDKYGTVKGVVYLEESFETFMDLVDRENAPIDNLFTSIFEKFYILGERDNLLQYSLIVYDKMINQSYPFPYTHSIDYKPSAFFPDKADLDKLNLRAFTYGLDLRDFVSLVLEKYIVRFIAACWDEDLLRADDNVLGGVKNGSRH